MSAPMKTRTVYVIARTAARRPTLQHILGRNDTTVCGLDMTEWSRAYQRERVPQIACKRCAATHPRRHAVTA